MATDRYVGKRAGTAPINAQLAVTAALPVSQLGTETRKARTSALLALSSQLFSLKHLTLLYTKKGLF